MTRLDVMAIPLTQNLYALVDGKNHKRLDSFKWQAAKSRGKMYARRSEKRNGKKSNI